jgi:hypothetical protein
MSDDDATDGISQQGEPNATPVVTNEDDVSTESDLIGDQIPEKVTTRRSSGMAGPTLDSSRSSLSSLRSARGPAEEFDQHESKCHKIRHEIDTFFGPHPLGESCTDEFARICDEPIPRAPHCEKLITFMRLEISEISDNELRLVKLVLKNRKRDYEDICSTRMTAADKVKIKSRRSSLGAIDKPIQMEFKEQIDRPLTEQENKPLNEMTSSYDVPPKHLLRRDARSRLKTG